MDQLICASLSHTHYWYEVGVLKVPAVVVIIKSINQSIINHHAGTSTEASRKVIRTQTYKIFELLIGVPDYSSEVIQPVMNARALQRILHIEDSAEHSRYT